MDEVQKTFINACLYFLLCHVINTQNNTILTATLSVNCDHDCRYGTDEAAIYSGKCIKPSQTHDPVSGWSPLSFAAWNIKLSCLLWAMSHSICTTVRYQPVWYLFPLYLATLPCQNSGDTGYILMFNLISNRMGFWLGQILIETATYSFSLKCLFETHGRQSKSFLLFLHSFPTLLFNVSLTKSGHSKSVVYIFILIDDESSPFPPFINLVEASNLSMRQFISTRTWPRGQNVVHFVPVCYDLAPQIEMQRTCSALAVPCSAILQCTARPLKGPSAMHFRVKGNAL